MGRKRRKGPKVKRSAWRDGDEARRVSVFLPESHLRRLKATAAQRGLTVTQLVTIWIDAHGEAAG